MSLLLTALSVSLLQSPEPTVLRVPLQMEQPAGYADNPSTLQTPLRQDLGVAKLKLGAPGRVTLTLGEGDAKVEHADIDISLLVPRIPAAARKDPNLVRFALFQREFNRNEVRFGPAGGIDELKIANNCLKRGLWEIMLDKKGEKGNAMVFHAWMPFPRDVYAEEYQRLNQAPIAEYEAMMAEYPRIDGLAAPIDQLRKVDDEKSVQVEAFWSETAIRFGEQKRKAKLIVTPGLERYRDFIDPAKQPVAVASFQEPGLYDRTKPFTADLRWIAEPQKAKHRTVLAFPGGEKVQEVEILFADGRRLILADRRLSDLPERTEAPTDDKDTLRLTFGIGTPDIYAARADRERELAEDRPSWLMLLGPDGKHVDNHTQGVDRIFLWREGGSNPRLHMYLVGYERIAVVGHLAIPWTGPKG
ncbi:MAG: hypothetical protein NTY35_02055 [Planctomycetota bacterium]|nr:hypothetical protein [Planctomycetota bacterium]